VHRLFGKIKIAEQADQSCQDSPRIHAIKGVEQFAYLLDGTLIRSCHRAAFADLICSALSFGSALRHCSGAAPGADVSFLLYRKSAWRTSVGGHFDCDQRTSIRNRSRHRF
jgi:hypothetical protein